jgi:hypothetical protein
MEVGKKGDSDAIITKTNHPQVILEYVPGNGATNAIPPAERNRFSGRLVSLSPRV